MRALLISLALSLASCSQPPGPAQSAAQTPVSAPATPSAANADALTLQQPPAPGAWSATADEGVFSARFGERFILVCSAPNSAITLTFAGTSASSFRIITATRTLQLTARHGSVRLEVGAPEHDALISTLGTPGDRFAIDAGGAVTVFPWDDALATTLSACR